MNTNTPQTKKSDYDKICAGIFNAWKALKHHPHKETVGVDDVSIKIFAKDERKNIKSIRDDLRKDRYQFDSLKLKEIPKNSGKGKRPLLLATVSDRVVSKAILKVVGPKIKRSYPSKVSYCSVVPKDKRKKIRTLQDGVQLVKQSYLDGYRFFYETDIANFFNQINKEEVLKDIVPLVDPKTYSLIAQIVNFEVVGENASLYFKPGYAVAQGSSLSPLLADIYLNKFDKFLEELAQTHDIVPVRYVDDLVILTRQLPIAKGLAMLVSEKLKEKGLTTKAEKTNCGARSSRSFKFLGIVFNEGRLSLPSDKKKSVLKKLEETLKAEHPKNLPAKLERVSSRLIMNIKYYQRIDPRDFNRQLTEIIDSAEDLVQEYFVTKQKQILGLNILGDSKISPKQRLEYFRFLGLNFETLKSRVSQKTRGK